MAITFTSNIRVNVFNLKVNDRDYSFDYEIIFNGRSCKGNYNSTFTIDSGKMQMYLVNGGAEDLILSTECLSDYEDWEKVKTV